VIAPDVGDVREIVVDGESGLLLPSLADDAEMAAAYAAAIVRLVNDGGLRARTVAGALKRLVDRHSPAAFTEAARAIFGDCETAGQQPGSAPQKIAAMGSARHEDELMVADRTHATADRPGSAAPVPDVQALLERVAFLEEQILEMRRGAMVEKAQWATMIKEARSAAMIEEARSASPPMRSPLYWLRESLKVRLLSRPIERLIKRLRRKL
jgi:hypothetical protein